MRQLPDLSTCAKEPIHIPGAIQEHGILIATDTTLRVTHFSENYPRLFPAITEGAPISSIVGEESCAALLAFFAGNNAEKYFLTKVTAADREFPCLVHKSKHTYIFEIGLHGLEEGGESALLKRVNRLLAVLSEAEELDYLLSRITVTLRDFLNIDRVMVYRFDENWNGAVIAESRKEGLPSYLNLHFPASDIPEQARSLYQRNWLRTIPDVHYSPVRIFPDCSAGAAAPLDLSDSVFRSISPVHIEYLKNMNVAATVVMSIISNGKLWGLVACHHYSPHFLPIEIRYISEMFAKILSSSIQKILLVHHSKHTSFGQELLNRVNVNILKYWSVSKALLEHDPDLSELVPCHGAVVAENGKLSVSGEVPDQRFLMSLFNWLDENQEKDILFSNHLQKDWPEAVIPESASGILSLRLGKAPHDYIVLFRSERIGHIHWAGDPYSKNADASGRLSPRKSFELFKETVRNTSSKWEQHEIEIMLQLRVYILEFLAFEKIRLETLVNEKTQQLSRTLQVMEAAKGHAEQNAALKSHMLASMSHEIRTPLNGILGITHILAAKSHDPEQKNYLELIIQSSNRLLKTLTSVLELAEIEANKKDIKIQECSVDPLVEEAINILQPLAASKGIAIMYHASLENHSCLADPNMVSQIIYNILGNAIKYTVKGEIAISVSAVIMDQMKYTSVIVSDTGIGISKEFLPRIFDPFTQESMGLGRRFEGTGLGLSITKKYIDLIGGTVSVISEKGKGSTFEVRLPWKKSR